MWSFPGSWFLTLEFPRGVRHNFAEFPEVKACLFGISKARVPGTI